MDDRFLEKMREEPRPAFARSLRERLRNIEDATETRRSVWRPALASVFAGHGINIDAILQEPGFPADRRPFVVSLDAAPSQVLEAALGEIATLDFHVVPPFAMPVLT